MAKEDNAHKKARAKKATRKEADKPKLGRPAMFQTPQQMQERIDAYFESCKPTFLTIKGKPILDKTGNPVIDYNKPTMSGLALFLNFADISSLYEYEKKPVFTQTIARARTRMISDAERDLRNGQNVPGNEFWLSNIGGWRKKQEIKQDVEITASVSSFSVNQFLEKFNAEK